MAPPACPPFNMHLFPQLSTPLQQARAGACSPPRWPPRCWPATPTTTTAGTWWSRCWRRGGSRPAAASSWHSGGPQLPSVYIYGAGRCRRQVRVVAAGDRRVLSLLGWVRGPRRALLPPHTLECSATFSPPFRLCAAPASCPSRRCRWSSRATRPTPRLCCSTPCSPGEGDCCWGMPAPGLPCLTTAEEEQLPYGMPAVPIFLPITPSLTVCSSIPPLPTPGGTPACATPL